MSSKKVAKKSRKAAPKAPKGDAVRDALEVALVTACQTKLNDLQNQYSAGTYLENDAIAHLGKMVKISHWVRSLVNQTTN